MAMRKVYAGETQIDAAVIADLTDESAALVSSGYPFADLYITGAAIDTAYVLYRRDGTEAPPTASQKKRSVGTFPATTAGGRVALHGVSLVESQTFYLDGSGTVELRANRYTYDDGL